MPKVRTLPLFIFGLLLNLCQIGEGRAAPRLKNNISYESYQLLYDKNSTGVINDDALGLTLSWQSERRRWSSVFQGEARFYQGSNDYTLSVPEAYLQWQHPSQDLQITLGRQLLAWNPTEEFWLQSQVNIRQGQSLMNESQEGLTGLRAAWQNEHLAAEFFGSFTYVPRLTSAWKVRDGKLYNTAYWEVSPPTSTTILGQEVPIHYQLTRPKVRKILWRPAVGLRLGPQWGDAEQKTSLQAYAMVKPENIMRATASGHLDVGAASPVFMADVGVRVHYQDVYGVDLGHRWDRWKFNLGFRGIVPHAEPQRDYLPYMANVSHRQGEYLQFDTRQRRQSYFDALISYGGEYWRWAVSYIRYLRGHSPTQEMLTTISEWQNAIGGKLSYAFNDIWQTSFKTQYDMARHDLLLRGELNFNFWQSVALTMGMELLKTNPKSYWYKYRQKSTVYSSLSYSF